MDASQNGYTNRQLRLEHVTRDLLTGPHPTKLELLSLRGAQLDARYGASNLAPHKVNGHQADPVTGGHVTPCGVWLIAIQFNGGLGFWVLVDLGGLFGKSQMFDAVEGAGEQWRWG